MNELATANGGRLGVGPEGVGGAGANKSADSNSLALSLDVELGLGSVLVDVTRRVNRW